MYSLKGKFKGRIVVIVWEENQVQVTDEEAEDAFLDEVVNGAEIPASTISWKGIEALRSPMATYIIAGRILRDMEVASGEVPSHEVPSLPEGAIG